MRMLLVVVLLWISGGCLALIQQRVERFLNGNAKAIADWKRSPFPETSQVLVWDAMGGSLLVASSKNETQMAFLTMDWDVLPMDIRFHANGRVVVNAQGHLWFVSVMEATRLACERNGKSMDCHSVESVALPSSVHSITALGDGYDGSVLVGTLAGALIVNAKKIYAIPGIEGKVLCVCQLEHVVVAGTADALFVYDMEEEKLRHYWVGGLLDGPIQSLAWTQKPFPRLWVGNAIALSWMWPSEVGGYQFTRVGGLVQQPGPLMGGLPRGNISSLSVGKGSKGEEVIWMGTEDGVVRGWWDEEKKKWEFALYSGPRYFPTTNVQGAVVEVSASIRGFALARVENGFSFFWLEEMTLRAKADHFQAQVEPRHDRWGLVAMVNLKAFGDLSSFEKIPGESDGLWTSLYTTAAALEYHVSQDPLVKMRAWKHFEALEWLVNVTGIPGLIARTVVHPPEPYQSGSCWHNSTMGDGQWQFMSCTSSDTITGILQAFGAVLDFVATSSEEEHRVKRVIDLCVGHILEHDFYELDVDGQPTRWGVWNHRQLNEDPAWADERGLNSLQILSFLALAARATGDERYGKALIELRREHGYGENLLNARLTARDDTNFSDDELLHLAMFMYASSLYDRETLPGIARDELNDMRAELEKSTWRTWEITCGERNPFFQAVDLDILQVKTLPCPSLPRGVTEYTSQWTLERWPWSLIEFDSVNANRHDIVLNTDQLRAEKPVRGGLQSQRVLPPDERVLKKFNADPFTVSSLETGAGGRAEDDPGAFLLGYWLGVAKGFISKNA